MQGKIDYNELNDLISECSGDNEKSFQNMTMLVNLYFPRLQKNLEELIEYRESLGELAGQIRVTCRKGKTVEVGLQNKYVEMVARSDKVEKNFEDAIFREGMFINRPWRKLFKK
ncbi:MAG: hypothetical protein KAT46_02870 [Deltaproteobacteria bacterium]|nr:hypothetical protein [Deltaproteobacteria bacterium]